MAVTSWPWQHCTLLSHRHPGLLENHHLQGRVELRWRGGGEVVAGRWLVVIYVWTERTVSRYISGRFLHINWAHMKFNQIPSASLHNSDLLIMHSSSRPENNTNQPWPAVPSLPWWWWKTELRHPSVIVQPEYSAQHVTETYYKSFTSVGMF